MREVVSVSEARRKLADIVDRVGSEGVRIVLRRRGRDVAALVSPSDLEALDALDDRCDLLDSLDALADVRTRGGVPWAELKDDTGH